MATPRRIWYRGASYHITSRGNHRDDIFREKADFNMYLTMMRESLSYYEEYNYELVCYCLMTNHVHLLIRANEKETANLIRRVHSMYSRYFNKKYNYTGHLWQDKYFAELIKDDIQMLETSRYIHLNPVKANIVKKAEEYQWSSYSMYIEKTKEKLINSEILLKYFCNRNAYKAFVLQGINDKYHKEIVENQGDVD